jgi:hypothetical protein
MLGPSCFRNGKVKEFLTTNKVLGDFTFKDLGFPNHSDKWVLKDLEEQKKCRLDLKRLLAHQVMVLKHLQTQSFSNLQK